jgi:hypothetical protein
MVLAMDRPISMACALVATAAGLIGGDDGRESFDLHDGDAEIGHGVADSEPRLIEDPQHVPYQGQH